MFLGVMLFGFHDTIDRLPVLRDMVFEIMGLSSGSQFDTAPTYSNVVKARSGITGRSNYLRGIGGSCWGAPHDIETFPLRSVKTEFCGFSEVPR